MSILVNKDTHVVIQGGVAGQNAARRMAEFCYLNKKSLYVDAFVYPPDAGLRGGSPATAGSVTATFESGGKQYSRDIRRIDYPHIPIQSNFPPASARLAARSIRRDSIRSQEVAASRTARRKGMRMGRAIPPPGLASNARHGASTCAGVRGRSPRGGTRRTTARAVDEIPLRGFADTSDNQRRRAAV